MESLLWTVKFVLFLAMEVFVVATVGAVLITGLYQFIRDRVRSIQDKSVRTASLSSLQLEKVDSR
jgi:hypothetical protein